MSNRYRSRRYCQNAAETAPEADDGEAEAHAAEKAGLIPSASTIFLIRCSRLFTVDQYLHELIHTDALFPLRRSIVYT